MNLRLNLSRCAHLSIGVVKDVTIEESNEANENCKPTTVDATVSNDIAFPFETWNRSPFD